MSEISISRGKAIEHLKRHSYWTSDDYSWIDDVCDKAISDMEKLEKIEEVISAMENTDDETVESFAFREIEQIVEG